MIDAGYVREKLGKVIEGLSADGAAPIRLVAAGVELNALVNGTRPWELDPAHEWIRDGILKIVGGLMTVADLSGKVGSIQATAASLDEYEARNRCAEILAFAKKAKAALD